MRHLRFPLFFLFILASLAGCSSGDSTNSGDLALMPRGDDACDDRDCEDWPSDHQCDDWTTGDDDHDDECKLDCPQGGPTGPIAVHFDCTEVHVVSCKELSNVVLAFEDGEHYKYDGLKGHYGTFGAGDRNISTVWVKAGNNGSGDGPGYGMRFDSDLDCDEDGGAGGAGGMGGHGGAAGMAGGGGAAGSAGSAGMGGYGGAGGMGGSGGTSCEPHDPGMCKDECAHYYEGCKRGCDHDDEDCKYHCDHDNEGCKHSCDTGYEDCKYECDPDDSDCKDRCDYHYDHCKHQCDYDYDHCKEDCSEEYDSCKHECDDEDSECKHECDDEDSDSDCNDECDDGDYDGGHYCSCDSSLECPHGGKYGHIEVDFECTEVHVSSCKDISNVVLELDGGEHYKFDGLSGHCATLGVADRLISGVWVKAGNNKSGDGPGYGERFDSDAEDCDGAGGSGGAGGEAGAGGMGGMGGMNGGYGGSAGSAGGAGIVVP